LILDASGWRSPAPDRQPQQSRRRYKISKKSADQGGRQARLRPSKAERGAGDTEAPQGAVR